MLGRGGIDRVLLLAPGHEPLLTDGAKSLQPAHSDISVSFQLPGLEVSVVDHQSRELLLLTATDLHASVAFGSNPATGGHCLGAERGEAAGREVLRAV